MTLAEYLSETGRSQAALAADLDITPGALCNLLRGHRRPSLALALRLQHEFGVSVESWPARKSVKRP